MVSDLTPSEYTAKVAGFFPPDAILSQTQERMLNRNQPEDKLSAGVINVSLVRNNAKSVLHKQAWPCICYAAGQTLLCKQDSETILLEYMPCFITYRF